MRPRIAFCCEQDGYLWLNTVSDLARDARAKWCYETSQDWVTWRKQRPTLRVVKVEVRLAATDTGAKDE